MRGRHPLLGDGDRHGDGTMPPVIGRGMVHGGTLSNSPIEQDRGRTPRPVRRVPGPGRVRRARALAVTLHNSAPSLRACTRAGPILASCDRVADRWGVLDALVRHPAGEL